MFQAIPIVALHFNEVTGTTNPAKTTRPWLIQPIQALSLVSRHFECVTAGTP